MSVAARMFTFVFICLSLKILSSLAITELKRNIANKESLYIGQESFDGQRFTYVACTEHSNRHVSHCQIFLETLSPETIRTCNVTVASDSYSMPRLFSLGADRVVLAWPSLNRTDPHMIKKGMWFFTVEMDSCTNNRITFEDMFEHYVSIRPRNESTFDVVLLDNGYSFCKWTLDVVNNSVSGPFDCATEDETNRISDMSPLVAGLPYMGLRIINDADERWLIIDDKKMKMKTNVNLSVNMTTFGAPTSTSHDKLAVCSITSCKPTCWQFNQTGELMNIVNLADELRFDGVNAVYNLPGEYGGLYLATAICEDCKRRNPCKATYSVSKFSETGKRAMTMVIQDFNCNRHRFANFAVLKFYENDEGSVCLMMACYRRAATLHFLVPEEETGLPLTMVTTCFEF